MDLCFRKGLFFSKVRDGGEVERLPLIVFIVFRGRGDSGGRTQWGKDRAPPSGGTLVGPVRKLSMGPGTILGGL